MPQFSVTVSDDILQAIDAVCEAEDLSRSKWMGDAAKAVLNPDHSKQQEALEQLELENNRLSLDLKKITEERDRLAAEITDLKLVTEKQRADHAQAHLDLDKLRTDHAQLETDAAQLRLDCERLKGDVGRLTAELDLRKDSESYLKGIIHELTRKIPDQKALSAAPKENTISRAWRSFWHGGNKEQQ